MESLTTNKGTIPFYSENEECTDRKLDILGILGIVNVFRKGKHSINIDIEE